jgi:peptidoglycan/LPS O-acetylase OafA/YrhL
MQGLEDWRDALGILSVVMAILAAVVYVFQTLRGEVRPHPLSWFLFGILSATGYWVQRDQGANQGSWTLLAMTIICFIFVAVSVARGERSFSRQEWAFAVAGGAVFVVYLFTREANIAAALTTVVDALGYGPTFIRGWTHPKKDSVTSSRSTVPNLFPR